MGRNIAIVEDEPAIRANYVEALTRFGYQVHGYGSRPEASRAFAARMPDLIIIDVGLGDEPEGGFELCRELRAKSSTLPLISSPRAIRISTSSPACVSVPTTT